MAAAAAVLAMSTPATAIDLERLSAAEREAFGAAVREYLLENPEVLMEAIAILEARQEAEQAMADLELVATHAQALFDDGHSVVSGNPDGDVTVVEFIDYRCTYCRRAHPEVAELVETDGNIRVITKEFPILGPESVEASRFAISVLQVAGKEAYMKINETLIAHRGAFSRDALARIAAGAGLDSESIIARMDDEDVARVIRQNRQLGQAMQISGTPTFVFGDRMVRGYVPLEGMRGVVAELRAD